ncbi:MAG: pectinesterase family protein [Saprospiraceae bacterium]
MNQKILPLFLFFFVIISLSANGQYATKITVAKDGTGDFTSIQAALNATKSFPDKHITIFIKNGTYTEKVRVYAWNTNLSIIGESQKNTIITFDDYFQKVDKGRNSTFHTSTFSVEADDVILKNLTIINSAGKDNHQAVALTVSGNRCTIENCTIKGNQDTLYLTGENSKQYFKNCYIDGTTDFIFGNATVLFKSCIIHSKSNSYITAASTTASQKHGFVFKNCELTADKNVDKVYLGRPWRKFAKTVFINCKYGQHIVPEGWKEWSNKDDLATTFYAEFTTENIENRVSWSQQLTKRQADFYTKNNILGNWEKPQLYTQKELPLYENKVPNNRHVADPETVVERGKNNRAFINTSVPTLMVLQPKKPNGQAVIICPGGGYTKTAYDKEGVLVAQALVKKGVTCFVLKYRIPQDLTNVDKSIAPLQDAQQAIRYARKNAKLYGLNYHQIGIMGFSAGGHLAASAATHFQTNADHNETDTTSVRPDFVALIYPVISFKKELTHNGSRINLIGKFPKKSEVLKWSNEEQVTSDSPPTFLVHAADDKAVSVRNSLAYYSACLEQNVLAEMHLYPNGGHGFGLYNSTTEDFWLDRFVNFLNGLK